MLTSRRLAGALCAALLLAACSSGEADPEDGASSADTASPVTTESPSPAASTTSEDPWAVPDPITEEYVDRVVNRIYEEWGAITREILEQDPDPTGTTPVEVRERIAELFGGEYLLQRTEEANNVLRGDREGLLPAEEFEQLRVEIRQIKTATTSCIVFAGDLSFENTAVDGDSELAALSLQAEPDSLTGWTLIDVVRARDSEGNRLPDEAILDNSTSDLEPVLDNSCGDADG